MQNGKYIVDVVNNQITNGVPYVKEVVESGLTLYDLLWRVGLIIAALIFISLVVVIVKQQTVKIVERLGKFNRVMSPGLNFKIPFIDKVVADMDLRIMELSENVEAKSSDNAFINVPVKVQYCILPDKAKDAYYTLTDSEEQIKSYVVNIIRSTATEMDLEQVFKSKNKFEAEVRTDLKEKFAGFGFDIVNVLVDNPTPSKAVMESFDKVIASKRMREASENEAEAIRIKTVAGAKAEAESLTLKAKAYVEQRKTIAEGMKDIGKDKDFLEYIVGIDWRDTVRDAAQHGAVIMIPTDMRGANMAETIGALKVTK